MTVEEEASWFAKVADVFAQVPGLYRVYGVKGDDGDPKVVPMSAELPTGSVVGVLGYDGGEVSPASWERQEHTLQAAVWVPASAGSLDVAYTTAIAYIDRVMDTFPPRAKPGSVVDEAIQSCLVTGFDTVESRVWGDSEGEREYVVLPFTLQVIRARAVRYVSA